MALIAADIVTSQAASTGEAREFSRVELIMRAHETAYVQLPAHPAELPPAMEEPKILASHLAVEIDQAESSDTPSPSQTLSQPAIRAPAQGGTTNFDITRNARVTAKSIKLATVKLAHRNIAAPIQPELELKKSRSPVPEQQVATAATLKSAAEAELPAKREPVRKKLAHSHPTSGELVTMQLLNQI